MEGVHVGGDDEEMVKDDALVAQHDDQTPASAERNRPRLIGPAISLSLIGPLPKRPIWSARSLSTLRGQERILNL